ncbi:MAG: transglutaminase family protein [Hyphomicrobiales bacterium]|nr:MAG: transglutaminase family protein [Hyphomicrobiales bacterium]
MKFSLGSELIYTAERETTLILNIEAQHMQAGQKVLRERFAINPDLRSEPHEIPETLNRYRRLVLQPGRYTIRYEAEVATDPVLTHPGQVDEVPVAELPLGVMSHLFPSRYCESDQLARFAWRRFGDAPAGHQRVDAICDWIHDNVDYLEGSSDGSTSAYDTFTTRAGVCRDFAHLGITFCRALGIPARFVSAYGWKLEPQDFHAVFEAYLSGRWYLFDPTRLSPPDGVIRIGVGRDAADTAFATWFGQMQSEPKSVWVEAVAEATAAPEQAVSLSAT